MTTEGSKLGTIEHWESAYSQEINNFNSHGDIGEIWFGSKSVNKMINWIRSSGLSTTSQILDIGCGNGHLLIELYNAGYKNSMGIDYSENAISLSKSIINQMGILDITFKTLDFLSESLNQSFDLILDKGTFDAISLSSNSSFKDLYLAQVFNHLNSDGIFLITSCNFTQQELESIFAPDLMLLSMVKYPLFSFGGSVGSTIVTCAFKKSIESA